jgi:hypothetical protein
MKANQNKTKKGMILGSILVVLLICLISIAGCSKKPGAELVGKWLYADDEVFLELNKNGTGLFESEDAFKWSIEDGRLVIIFDDDLADRVVFDYALAGSELTLTFYDEEVIVAEEIDVDTEAGTIDVEAVGVDVEAQDSTETEDKALSFVLKRG